jgi:hypothetical protein
VEGYTLHINLLEIEPAIWRRLVVPGSMTLAKLHRAIQVAMGWESYHVYLFTVGRHSYGEGVSEWNELEQRVQNAKRTTLEEVAPRKGARFLYTYDMGDGWNHEIRVEAIQNESLTNIRCLAGERSCPPEDCGGPPGYERLLEKLFDPKHPEHHEMKEWAGDFSPESFSVEAVNRRLARLKAA